VELIAANGTVLHTFLLNREGTLGTISFPTVPAGSYTVRATLFPLANGGGSASGTVVESIALNGLLRYRTSLAEVEAIRVSPATGQVTIPEGLRFTAAGTTTTGAAVFTDQTDFTWTVLGGVGTVNAEGQFGSTTAGVGSVRAAHGPSGRLGSASITVSPQNTRRSKWTVLVFMNAANDLSAFDTSNMNQMESVAQNPDVRFVVQWKQSSGSWDPDPEFEGTRRYLVSADTSRNVVSPVIQDLGQNVDMGRAETMTAFINWAKTFYPADRYCLVIWNHGNGWKRSRAVLPPTRGVSYDDDTGNHIETWQLAQAIGGTDWDILSWDASLMQMLEVAYEVKDTVQYVVGSEESPPGEGLPYDRIFGRFRDNPNESTRNLTKAFVDGMLAVPEYASRKITQSSVDTSQLDSLRDALSNLSDALIANRSSLTSVIPQVRGATKDFGDPRLNYFDIGDMCRQLEARTSIPAVTNASIAVRSALQNAVVWEGHNSNSEGSTGLSIDFSPSTSFSGLTYGLLRFGRESRWDEWLSVAP
jgi:hypothetical protein